MKHSHHEGKRHEPIADVTIKHITALMTEAASADLCHDCTMKYVLSSMVINVYKNIYEEAGGKGELDFIAMINEMAIIALTLEDSEVSEITIIKGRKH